MIFSIISSQKQPKLCINCKYFKDNGSSQIFGKCALFPNIYIGEHLVVGTKENYLLYCSSARNNENLCGKEAKGFIRKYKKRVKKERNFE
jgi:hypothetical protein